MAVVIRLVRMGRRNRAFFRVRASDRRDAAGGRFLEELGFLDPIEKDPSKALKLNKDRIEFWLGRGAQPSDSVRSLLKKQGIGEPAKA